MRLKLFCLFALLLVAALPGPLAAQTAETPIVLFLEQDLWTYTPSTGAFAQWTENAYIDRDSVSISPDGTRLVYKYAAPVTVEAWERVGGFSGYPPSDIGFGYLDTGQLHTAAEQPPDAVLFAEDGRPDSAIERSNPTWAPGSECFAWAEVHHPSYAPETNRLMKFCWQPGEPEAIVSGLPEQAGVPGPLHVEWGPGGLAVLSYEYVEGKFITNLLLYNEFGTLLGQTNLTGPDEVGYLMDMHWLGDQIGLLYDDAEWRVVDPQTLAVTPLGTTPFLRSSLAPETSLALQFSEDPEASPLRDRLWKVWQPGGEALDLPYHGYHLVLAPDGSAVAYVNDIGQLVIWRPDGIEEIDTPFMLPDARSFTPVFWGPAEWDNRLPAGTGRLFECPGAPMARLVVGQSGRVIPGTSPNNLRDQPGTSGTTVVGEVPAGGVFMVTGGPQCSDGLIWWLVNYEGTVGWTAEGDASAYWLEPVAE